jgi:hypothetical protein
MQIAGAGQAAWVTVSPGPLPVGFSRGWLKRVTMRTARVACCPSPSCSPCRLPGPRLGPPALASTRRSSLHGYPSGVCRFTVRPSTRTRPAAFRPHLPVRVGHPGGQAGSRVPRAGTPHAAAWDLSDRIRVVAYAAGKFLAGQHHRACRTPLPAAMACSSSAASAEPRCRLLALSACALLPISLVPFIEHARKGRAGPAPTARAYRVKP